MPTPINHFKQALQSGTPRFGSWLGVADPYMAELVGRAGFDWLLVDGEHAPNDIRSLMAQLQVLEGLGPDLVVRLPMGEDWLIKQALDIGAQTLMIPMVETGEQAAHLVRAMRYAPQGIRGMGAALARASQFSGITDYAATANDQMCLIVQVETAKGVDNLDDILAVDGVDGVFVGPADLSADMGYPGNPDAPQVQAVIADILRRSRAAGKGAGILSTEDAQTPTHIANGANFVAVGIDVTLFAAAMRTKAQTWCG